MSFWQPYVICFFLLTFLSGACSSREEVFQEKKWRETVASLNSEALYADHEQDGRFFNPWLPMPAKGFFDVLGWKLSKGREYSELESSFRPEVIPDTRARMLKTEGDFILWIGHNTFLIRVKDSYWLTDPIFSKRALLPARKTPPAISAMDLKELGMPLNVVISHNHYDHLDSASIADLPEDARIFVPLGLKNLVEEMGKQDVQEMDWWQEKSCGPQCRLICLPAQHWSLRADQWRNRSLWASYMLMIGDMTIYLGGDSGYFPGYREFGRRFPKIDYALMPTTAYHPRWFMHYAHMNVPEAFRAFSDLGARYFIPTQWGTFELGDEPVGYPAIDIRQEIQRQHLDSQRFKIMQIGEILPLHGN
ncbi:MBL fold metallo-hydrolase [bacterium]|nr:MBL fold metallo-hydrolase [bacterium]